MLTHPDPKRALVIGGGDGGTVRELLRHENLEEVVLVEIDEDVIDSSRQYLPTISSALDHPKLKIHVADGIEYVKNCADRRFDLIIVDSTDPVGPAEGLFNAEFYHQVHRCLTNDGILVAQSESPMFNAAVFQSVFQCHRDIFGAGQVHSYLAYIPTYPTGMWSFAYASKGSAHPLKLFDTERARQFSEHHRLRYYNEMVHSAAFALPNFVRELLV
jgi:spermidine synthase